MPPSLTQLVWDWSKLYDFGVGASYHGVQTLWVRLERRLRDDPHLLQEGWPEEVKSAPTKMCVVHAVCMLSPPVAVDLLKRLQTVPGFDVEQRTENGVTPMVAAAYNRFKTRVVLVTALLDLGANPNSPGDMVEKVNSKLAIRRKSALAHLLAPCTSIFGREAAFPTRSSHDTDSIQVLVEHGAHFGASYSCRPMTVVKEFRYGNERFKDGHCLPYQTCYRNNANGHFFSDLEFSAENAASPSVSWVKKLLRSHCRTTRVRVALTLRPPAELEAAKQTAKFRWQLPSPYIASSMRLVSNKPGLPVYKPIQREVYWTLYGLSRTTLVPQDVHVLILRYLIPTYPYVGFYDETRLERLWNRQRSSYIDTGYVVPAGPVTSAREQAEIVRLERALCATMEPIEYGQHPRVSVAVDTAVYSDIAQVAAGLYGTTSSICPDVYRRVISRKFRRIGGYIIPFARLGDSPEQVQRQLMLGYVGASRALNDADFALWLCVEVLRSALRRVYEALKAEKPIDRLTYLPLTEEQVISVAEQFGFS